VAALVILTLAGAVLGYRSIDPPAAPQSGAPRPASVRQVTPAAEIPSPPAPVVSRASEGTEVLDQGIQDALGRWQGAMLSGDPDRIMECYAPQLERYYTQRNTSSEEVRRAAQRSASRYGRPAIVRISAVSIVPISQNRSIADFRRHWQTRGPKVYAGEDQERITFVRMGGEWKIASEEQTKVYWTQRPR
jgi:hypothetical protein